MNKVLPFETEAPDYQAAYLRLVDKIWRTGLYYEFAARNWQAKFGSSSDPVAEKLAASLKRCADDMEYIFDRAAFILPRDVVRELKDNAPTPFARDKKGEVKVA